MWYGIRTRPVLTDEHVGDCVLRLVGVGGPGKQKLFIDRN